MCNGASHSDSFPEPYFEDPAILEGQIGEEDAAGGTSTSRVNLDILQKYKQLPEMRAGDKELHLRRIAGLDVQDWALQEAIDATAPPPVEPSPMASYYSAARERWEDLRVEIWQGSLDVYNEAFDNFEAMIMTEVIEHLHPKALHKFPDIVFDDYRPRVVVVTTPNYDFNKYFDLATRRAKDAKRHGSEKAEAETKNSFLDPTGRTDRRFRDDDHKFEWTEAEFKEWCDSIVAKYDYTVEMTGVGSLRNFFSKGGFHVVVPRSGGQDALQSAPLPDYVQEALDSVPDPMKFFATQIAVFHRKFAYESERNPRSPVQAPLAFYGTGPKKLQTASALLSEAAALGSTGPNSTGTSPNQQQHKLLRSHYYKASAAAGNPKSPEEIRAVLDELMRERMRMRSVSIRELWGREEVAIACGGYINKIIEAVIQDPDKAWDIEYKSAVLENGCQIEDAVFLILKDFVEPEPDWGFGDDEGDEEDLEEGVKSMWAGGDEISEDEAEDGKGPPKTKKQKKQERREQLERVAEEKRAQHAVRMEARIWEPEEGDDTWDDWQKKPVEVQGEKELDWDTSKIRPETSGWD